MVLLNIFYLVEKCMMLIENLIICSWENDIIIIVFSDLLVIFIMSFSTSNESLYFRLDVI